MLEKNLRCRKRIFSRNSGFKCRKNIKSERKRCLNIQPLIYVSFLIINYIKNRLKLKNNLPLKYRDIRNEDKIYLYHSKKPVIYYIKLASTQYRSITNSTLSINIKSSNKNAFNNELMQASPCVTVLSVRSFLVFPKSRKFYIVRDKTAVTKNKTITNATGITGLKNSIH